MGTCKLDDRYDCMPVIMRGCGLCINNPANGVAELRERCEKAERAFIELEQHHTNTEVDYIEEQEAHVAEKSYHEKTRLRLAAIEEQLAASRDAHAATRNRLGEYRFNLEEANTQIERLTRERDEARLVNQVVNYPGMASVIHGLAEAEGLLRKYAVEGNADSGFYCNICDCQTSAKQYALHRYVNHTTDCFLANRPANPAPANPSAGVLCPHCKRDIGNMAILYGRCPECGEVMVSDEDMAALQITAHTLTREDLPAGVREATEQVIAAARRVAEHAALLDEKGYRTASDADVELIEALKALGEVAG